MIALCPTHARRADIGVICREELYSAKRHPFNNSIVREDEFRLIGNDVSVKLGSNTYINTPRMLVIDQLDLVAITQESRYPVLRVVLMDRFNNWIGIIDENEWVFDRSAMWDFEYSANHLVVRSAPRNVTFSIDLQADLIKLRGDLYYNGFHVQISEDEVEFGGRSAMTIRNCTFQNSAVGIYVDLPLSRSSHFGA
jgi:hypothetical protein